MSGRGVEEPAPETADPEIVDTLHIATSAGVALAGLLTGYAAAQRWLWPTAFGLLVMVLLVGIVTSAWLFERGLVAPAD